MNYRDVQAVLAVVALGPEAMRDFLNIQEEDDISKFTLKYFGKEDLSSTTDADLLRETALKNLK